MRKIFGVCLIAVALAIFALPESNSSAQNLSGGRGSSYDTMPGRSAPIPAPVYQYYKSKEEIAWDLMLYGIRTIPAFKARIKDYNDLLAAYRQALRTVTQQDKD